MVTKNLSGKTSKYERPDKMSYRESLYMPVLPMAEGLSDEGVEVIVIRNLKILRKKSGYSQMDLSILAGLNPTTVGSIERGKSKPELKTIEKIARRLGVTEADLLNRTTADDDIPNKLARDKKSVNKGRKSK